ncbi:hypothetical protein SNE40_012560 [Patella caerulea]|uniref:Methyltransferase type 11 domain-containing protein n=1 Tax=Patella caerulea TaxID=87958 RepID=A0AAN8JRW1_PATCE
MALHDTAKTGFTQGKLYDENRPSYTDQVVDTIAQQIEDSHSHTEYDVLELGAGTGKFTKRIWPKLKNKSYLATEPSEGFLATLQQQCPGIKTVRCAASDIPLPDDSVKAVICAQCFHWFSTPESMDEIKRVMCQEGKLFLLWNVKDRNVEWVDTLIKILRQNQPPLPNYYTMNWKEDIDHYSGFKLQQLLELPGVEFGGSVDDLVKNAQSVSVVASMPKDEQDKLSERVRQYLIDIHQDKEYIKVPFKTMLFVYSKV